MNELKTDDRQMSISRKILKIKKHEKGLEAIRHNIQSSDIVDVIAAIPAEIRPKIISFCHINHGFYGKNESIDYVLIPQHLTEYAIVVSQAAYRSGGKGHVGHSLHFKIDRFEFNFPLQSIDSNKGFGEMVHGYMHGSGNGPLSLLVKMGVKVIFAEEAYKGFRGCSLKTNEGDILERPITSWRADVLEDHGVKVVKKYMDSWLTVVGGDKPKPAESDHNFDMDCHPDHIQSVIDRHEDHEYKESMRGENLDC